jgi:pyruvate-formate lyase-activating enzyme
MALGQFEASQEVRRLQTQKRALEMRLLLSPNREDEQRLQEVKKRIDRLAEEILFQAG